VSVSSLNVVCSPDSMAEAHLVPHRVDKSRVTRAGCSGRRLGLELAFCEIIQFWMAPKVVGENWLCLLGFCLGVSLPHLNFRLGLSEF
jgi:hypothetical protein